MMFEPGERFHYNNVGYIVLGLIVEEQTGLEFPEYIDNNIFLPCGRKDSGYFSMDKLPKNTALGYINEENGTWRTNIYFLPIKGCADGGEFYGYGIWISKKSDGIFKCHIMGYDRV